ncbi:MAG: hypothetical protein ACR2PZ_16110 [Pseudomonadales bacterium]
MVYGFSRSILALAWIAAFAGVAGLSWHNGTNAHHFYGIADDLEQTIRFAAPVDLIAYRQVAGQLVVQGEVIVEVAQPELEAQIRMLDEQVLALELSNRESRASIKAQIIELEADGQAALATVRAERQELLQRQRANRSFLADASTDDPFALAIGSLQMRERAMRRSTAARVDDLNSQLAQAKRPLDAQIDELRKQQQELLRKREALTVRANADGRVGSQLFQLGDRIPPFEPIMTVHGMRPTFVKGFIHEQVFNDVQIAQTVWVRSAAQQSGDWYPAVIESLGSRIVEFPLRLKVNPMAQAWGREVILKLQAQHQLLLGEKVEIQLAEPFTHWRQVVALRETLQ